MDKKNEDKKKEIIQNMDNLWKKLKNLFKKIRHYNMHYKRQARNAINTLYFETIPRIMALEDIVDDIEKQLESEVNHESY